MTKRHCRTLYSVLLIGHLAGWTGTLMETKAVNRLPEKSRAFFLRQHFTFFSNQTSFCDKEQDATKNEQKMLHVFHCLHLLAAWCSLSLLVLLVGYNITLLT